MRWKGKEVALSLLVVFIFLVTEVSSQRCVGQPEVVLVLDSSGNLTEAAIANWMKVQGLANSIVDRLGRRQSETRFALVTFSEGATIVQSLTRDTATIKTAIDNTTLTGLGRNPARGLRRSQRVLFDARTPSDKYVILVMTGAASLEEGAELIIGRRLAQQGVRIIVITIGSDIDRASSLVTNGNVIRARDHDSLSSLEGEVERAYMTCPQPAQICVGPPEVILIVDSSGSIVDKGSQNWDLMKRFAEDLVNRLGSKPNIRVGYIMFSDLVKVMTPLTSDLNQVRTDIRNSQLIGGHTNQADALKAARRLFLVSRTPSSKYIIMVTDGVPTQNKGEEIIVARILRSEGVEIVMIGVTNQINDTNLEALAGVNGAIFKTADFQTLGGEAARVISAATVCPPEPEVCEGDPEVVIVLDSSGSITDKGAQNWPLMKDFANGIIDGLRNKPGIRFAYVQFSNQAFLRSHLTSNISAIQTIIETSINLAGFTNQAAALRRVQEALYRANANTTKYVIFITDGEPTAEVGVEAALAQVLRSQGVSIISIGVTSDRNMTNLNALSGPSGLVLESERFEDLSGQLQLVVTAANLCPEPPVICDGPPEIFLVLDASGSIVDKGPNNWDLMKRFAANLVDGLSSKKEVRFALVRFSNDAETDLELTSNVGEVQRTIRQMENMGGFTNQYDALRRVQNGVYNARNGSSIYIIFVTDGSPTMEQGQEAKVARSLREQGVVIIAIGVTDERNQTNLRAIAGPVGPVFETEDFTSLNDQVAPIISAASICPEKPDICIKQPDIVIVIDASGSIVDKNSNNWNLMRRFGVNIVDSLQNRNGSRFAVVRFSNEAVIDLEFTSNATLVKEVITNSSNLGGFTNQYDALVKVQEVLYLGRNDSARYIIFVTDGEPTREQGRESRIALRLRRQGVKFIMIGVTKEINETNLYDLAGDTGNVFESETFENLGRRVANVLTASNVCPPEPEPCGGPPEMVLVLDSSDSSGAEIGPEAWNATKEYATQLLDDIKDRKDIRFGLVKYGRNAAFVESNLTSDVTSIETVMESSQYLGGASNLEAALLAARDILEESRSRAARYILLIAHGPATSPGKQVKVSQELGDSGILIVTVLLQAQETQQSFQVLTTDRGAAFVTTSFNPLPLQRQQVVAATNVCPSGTGSCFITNIVFAIDESGSIRDKGADNFFLLKEFVVRLARGISYRIPDARFGLVVFSGRASVVKELDNTDINRFVAMVRGLRYLDGETNLADAVQKSWEVIQRNSTGRAQIIIITDGEPNVQKGEEISVSRNVRSFGVGITAIGVTNRINNDTLENLAGSTDGVFYAETFQDLTNKVTPVLEASCGEHTKPGNCTGEPDIVFVIDSSGSITERNSSEWEVVKNFLSRTITQFAQVNPNARFGAVEFSETASVVFRLTSNVNTALRGIAQMPYLGSYTNMAEGIRVARMSVFNETRSNANKIMILITDGKSNIEEGNEIDEAIITKATPFNIRIVVIGVTEEPDYITLQQVATDSAAVIKTPSYQVLTNEIDRIINVSCSNESCAGPPDFILILDSSGSITDKGRSNWRYLQRFSQQLVTGLTRRRDPRFAYVQFSDGALIRVFFTRDPSEVTKSISESSHINGWTNQAAALRVAKELSYDTRPDAAKYVIMVTDGYPTVEIGAEQNVARQLRDMGMRIIMIGVTNDTNQRNLRGLAGYTGAWFYSKDFANLNDEVFGVIAAAEECPAGPSPCDARDVIIALQVTRSINNRGPDAFLQIQEFAINITQSMYKRYPDIRFGLIIFSGVSTPVLNIADYKNINDIEQAIRTVVPRGDSTNVGEAIAAVRRMIERQANRAAQMILITYEQSSSLQNAFNQASTARGVRIKIVGVGISTDRSFYDYMLGITSTPNNTVVVQRASDLQLVAQRVINRACTGGARPLPPVACTGPSDIVFALDASGSITERNKDEWPNAKAFLYSTIQLIAKNNPETRFGVVVFSTTSDVEFKLNTNTTDALNDVRNIRYRGSRTNIAQAIEQARMEVFNEARQNARKIMVIITDGKANERINEEFIQASISQGYPYGISFIVIGITAEPDYDTLEALASDPDRVIRSANFAILANEVQRVVNVACAVNMAQDPILDNIVDPTCAPLMLDVVLLVDSSGSIIKNDRSDRTWPTIKDTLATIVDGFPSNLGKDGVQIALAQFSDYTKVKFTLNRYSSPIAIKARISDLQNMRWSTNIADALRTTRKYLFNETAGDRPKARNVVVLLSDGESSGRQWDTRAEAEKLKQQGVEIVVVGFTEFTDSSVERSLQEIASNRDNYISYTKLMNNTSIVNQRLCRFR